MKYTIITHAFAALAITACLAGCTGAETGSEPDDIDEPTEESDDAISLGCFNSEYYCDLTVGSGVLSCPNLPDPTDVKITSTANGVVLEVDMQSWGRMQVSANAKASSLYTFHIGDSPTNNGWAGDAGTTQYDAEMHLYDNSLFVYRNDLGGSSLAGSMGDAIPGAVGSFCTVVADQAMVWYGTPSGASQSTRYLGLSDPFLFRPHMGDQKLFVGINRTVGSAARTGSAIGGVVRLSLAP